MWPKAIAQLIELLPHAARLLPMADKFFQQRNGMDESTRRAMDAMADGLRGDLGQVTAAHAGLYRKLEEQNDKLTAVAAEAVAARDASEAANRRIGEIERRLARANLFLVVLVALLLCAIVMLAVLLHHAR